MQEENNKESKIITLMSGARYELIEGVLYSLNWAEKGMFGQTLGKVIPPSLSRLILSEASEQRGPRSTRTSGASRKADKKHIKKYKKTRAAKNIQSKAKKTRVSLKSSLIKNSSK